MYYEDIIIKAIKSSCQTITNLKSAYMNCLSIITKACFSFSANEDQRFSEKR